MNNRKTAKYIELYERYKKLILSGMLAPGTKMPSVRRCSEQFSLSRTTVENAYGILAAEGYITAKPQSGYYVSKLPSGHAGGEVHPLRGKSQTEKKPIYDLVDVAADKESFDFTLWQRYVKSALRQSERLLFYGDSRGEEDLRAAIAKYVNDRRGVVGTGENVIVSAGTQVLLSILCVLMKERKTVAFLGFDFPKGRSVFEDYGKEVVLLSEGFDEKKLAESKASIIYVSPSHIDSAGGVLPMGERLRIIDYARKNDCIVIEDDYDSEFRYASRPILSLQGLDGGKNVIYVGTFSRMLLPSIRIGFMVLPGELCKAYAKRAHLYNQTASKAEQIALCRYITDGHLLSRIKKQRRSYEVKSEKICSRGNELFFGEAEFLRSETAYLIKVIDFKKRSSEALAKSALENGVRVRPLKEEGAILLSCAGFDAENTDDMLMRLKKAFD